MTRQPTLSGETDARLTRAQFADRHGVSAATVGNWIKRGWITEDPGTAKGGRGIDAEAADAELADRRRATGHGGTRRKTGRPPGKRDGPETDRARSKRDTTPPTPIEARQAVADRAAGRAEPLRPDERARVDELLALRRDELAPIAALPIEESGLSQNALDRLKTLVEIQQKDIRNRQLAATLIEAADAERAWSQALANIRARVNALPQRLGPVLADSLWPDAADDLRALLLESGADPDVVDAACRMVERPGNLPDLARRLVQNEVDRMAAAIAGKDNATR